ncbi:hypothetical protein G9A89_005590 [Geosiphon pyriformis]|nr:hypothetical protein G9A89_005590 [Geosiphon pyriformis]
MSNPAYRGRNRRDDSPREWNSRGRGRGDNAPGSGSRPQGTPQRGGRSRGDRPQHHFYDHAKALQAALPPSEAAKKSRDRLMENFNSAALSFEGSEAIVFLLQADQLDGAWKRLIHKPLTTQRQVRHFVNSCLLTADDKKEDVEDLVAKLGYGEGLDRLREIIGFRVSADAGQEPNLLSFQRVIIPFLALLTRTAITGCNLEGRKNAIYSVLYPNIDSFLKNQVLSVLETLIQRKSLDDQRLSSDAILRYDPDSFIPISFFQPFLSIVRLLNELLNIIKEASLNDSIHVTVKHLETLRKKWQDGIEKAEFSDSLAATSESIYCFDILDTEFEKLNKVLASGKQRLSEPKSEVKDNPGTKYKAMLERLNSDYDPPGELSTEGPRHDNDFSEIGKISILPTEKEILTNDREPFLPSSIPGAPHFLPNGPARLIDSQFRLFREDMINPIRIGVSNFVHYLSIPSADRKTQGGMFEKGRFKFDNGIDNGDLNVYSNVRFEDIIIDKRRGFSCRVLFTPPNIRNARTARERQEFWKKSKKLINGGLICVLWSNLKIHDQNSDNSNRTHRLFFGTVSDRNEEELAKHVEIAKIDIKFMDPSIYPIAIESMQHLNETNYGYSNYMVESTGVYLEAYYHVLKTLQKIIPSTLPLDRYLAPEFPSDTSAVIATPIYTRAPGHRFDLSHPSDINKGIGEILLNVQDEESRKSCLEKLIASGRVDRTQSEAMLNALSREIALIEGPPGTGKSYIGVQLMRVLCKLNIGPILCITYTNHALDQFLEDLLSPEIGIKNIVRLGSRTKSDIIKEYCLEEISRSRPKKPNERYMLHLIHSALENIVEKTKSITDRLRRRWLSWKEVQPLLYANYTDFYFKFQDQVADSIETNDDDDWKYVNSRNLFEQWVHGNDIKRAKQLQKLSQSLPQIQVASPNKFNPLNSSETIPAREKRKMKGKTKAKEEDDEVQEEIGEDLTSGIYQDQETILNSDFDTPYTSSFLQNWQVPKTNRSLDELLNDTDIWKMSQKERINLHNHWRREVQMESIEELKDLQNRYEEKSKEMDEIYNEGRRPILQNSQVIGMTTTGAAKFQSLVCSIGPRVIICEEAGEVLEAHILTSLSKATQHMILIGDHKQLRPHLSTYSLSMDSPIGKNYELDKSLFERLVRGDNAIKLPLSQLTTQRRMRPEISDLIRNTLYRDLEDDDVTKKYPKVHGAQHNVFFIEHGHSQDKPGGNQLALQSHSNAYEAAMVVEMVKYFVRNGYNDPKDIAILTPYLGQLIQIRDALKNSHVTVVIDERDQENIDDELNQDDSASNANQTSPEVTHINPIAERRSLQKQVILRTVDNFQGEEAKIVIISLVRNSAQGDERGSIGFLKSDNRTNVLLSRAKHGMYLLGDAKLFQKKSQMWDKVIDILRQRGQIGPAFPILCERHPQYVNEISNPQHFAEVSPDGGCMEPCQEILPKCGHICPYKCHFDDREHVGVFCHKPCPRLHPVCQHPCKKQCGEDCGMCKFQVEDIELLCGHTYTKPFCYQARDRAKIKCNKMVNRKLPTCEHEKNMHCFEDVKKSRCSQKCGKLLECGHNCQSECENCKNRSILANGGPPLDGDGQIIRSNHAQKCREICGRECAVPCSACAEECNWNCEHQGNCPLSCGAPCSRLPCDQRCPKILECGHQCPGVCGENCPPKDYCPICAPEKIRSQVVDVIMQATFEEVDWKEEHRLIKLDCDHCFTMESMDGIMELNDYYESVFENGIMVWKGIKQLPAENSAPKTCPNCRARINSRRYGRVIKKNTLNIQNKKFLQKYDQQMKKLSYSFGIATQAIEQKREKFLEGIKKSTKDYQSQDKKEVEYRAEFDEKIASRISEVTPFNSFEQVTQSWGIPRAQENLWRKHITFLTTIYYDLSLIIADTKNPPHKRAYEAAVSALYRRKTELDLDEVLDSFNKLGLTSIETIKDSQKYHFESLQQVGIPTPMVDQGIYLDAFLEIINVQKAMLLETSQIVAELKKEQFETPTRANVTEEKALEKPLWEKWLDFSLHLFETINSHLVTILRTAEKTRHERRFVIASLEKADMACRKARFLLRNPPGGNLTEKIRNDIRKHCPKIKEDLEILKKKLATMDVIYFQSQCNEKIEKILEEVNELLVQNEILTKEDKLNIFRAMKPEVGGGDHWFECPNGHPYTIGECGGAMQQSRCPECGAAIGGGDHRLTAGNRRNTEFQSFG